MEITRVSKLANMAVPVALLLATFASAQSTDAKPEVTSQPNFVRVCVPVMENTSARNINRRQQRDWLVRAFQPDKKKKAKHPETQRIEAVSLDSDSSADAAGEARDNNCDYVLYTTVVELREPGDPQRPNQPGSVAIGRDPLSVYPDAATMHDPVHYAVVDYRLQRVGDPEPRLASSVSGQEHSDEDGTVQRLLFLIVDSVKRELREPGSVSPR